MLHGEENKLTNEDIHTFASILTTEDIHTKTQECKLGFSIRYNFLLTITCNNNNNKTS